MREKYICKQTPKHNRESNKQRVLCARACDPRVLQTDVLQKAVGRVPQKYKDSENNPCTFPE